MAFSVVMPALEMAQETGKLLAWRKKEGDRVTKGEPLLEIETDKAVVEVEAPADGVLAGIKASEGADIPVGQTIAWIVEPGENPPLESAPLAPVARAGSHKPEPAQAAPTEQPTQMSPQTATAKISPKARRLAKELGVELALVVGSGPGGEILASDVEAASKLSVSLAATPATSPKLEVPTTLGRIMAERTTQSWTTIPHFFVSRDVDAAGLNEFRKSVVEEIERAHQLRVSHTDMLIALVARTLRKHPRLNASWSPHGIQFHDQVHMGVAVAVNDGVVAVVVHNADATSLADIAKTRRDLAERSRSGKLHPADISAATFTISNLGMYQVDQFNAIIAPPQAAILAVGSIADRVVALGGKPAVRPMMTLTLSCDHRVLDGARAAMFLKDLADAIGEPAKYLS